MVLTKVTRDGIVMAADTTLSETYKGFERHLVGATKLLPQPPSGSCLGTWGHGLLRLGETVSTFAMQMFDRHANV